MCVYCTVAPLCFEEFHCLWRHRQPERVPEVSDHILQDLQPDWPPRRQLDDGQGWHPRPGLLQHCVWGCEGSKLHQRHRHRWHLSVPRVVLPASNRNPSCHKSSATTYVIFIGWICLQLMQFIHWPQSVVGWLLVAVVVLKVADFVVTVFRASALNYLRAHVCGVTFEHMFTCISHMESFLCCSNFGAAQL